MYHPHQPGTMRVIICVLFISLNLIAKNKALEIPTVKEEERIEKACNATIQDGLKLLPGLVRLAFHDCVGEAGCNGCIDTTNDDNAGLEDYVNSLEVVYKESFSKTLSRADFWILCSFVAVKEGYRQAPPPKKGEQPPPPPHLVMKYGREDCSDESPFHDARDKYPSPHDGYNRTTGYFASEFGLNERETTALLGAHTLGRARTDNSGFMNSWVDNEFSLDNQLYTDMIDSTLNWTQINVTRNHPSPRYQWVRRETNGSLLFNSDLSLAKDLQPEDDGSMLGTDLDVVNQSHGHTVVGEYAKSNALWLRDFSAAFTKMVEKLPKGSKIILTEAPYEGDYYGGSGAGVLTSLSIYTITVIFPAIYALI